MGSLIGAVTVLAAGWVVSAQDVSPAAASEPSSSSRPALIANPSWKIPPAPTEADYPILAAHVGIGGRVSLQCVVSVTGKPESCEVVQASPQGMGFEQAAIEIVSRGLMNPRTVDGVPVSAQFSISLPFSPVEEEPTGRREWDGPDPSNAQLLAGLVFAQRLASQEAFGTPLDWGLQQLSPDRAASVKAWADELYVGKVHIQLVARSIAMVLAKRGVTIIPAEKPADWHQWMLEMDRAMTSIYTDENNFAPMKQRYCARYDCGPFSASR